MRLKILLGFLLSVAAAGAARAFAPLPDPASIVGNCGEVRIGEFGCSDAQCEACVCGESPNCCAPPDVAPGAAAGGTGWDGACVFIAGGLPQADCSGACLVARRRAAPMVSSTSLAVTGLVLVVLAAYRLRKRTSS